MYDAIYTVLIYAYHVTTYFVAWFNPKARKRIELLRSSSLPESYPPGITRYWFHCASLGEYDMIKPLINLFRLNEPDCFIAVSFYSPSGYLNKGINEDVNWFGMLPIDTPLKARTWVKRLNPHLAVFVKYEFWFNLLNELRRNNIPSVLVAARFTDVHQGLFYRIHLMKTLPCFSLILTANRSGITWLKQLGIKADWGGDTRVDAIKNKMISPNIQSKGSLQSIAKNFIDRENPRQEGSVYKKENQISSIANPTIVWGSIWPSDVHLIRKMISDPELQNWRHIIVPHEIETNVLNTIIQQSGVDGRYSLESLGGPEKRIHLVDAMGKLLWLYGQADVAYIGGGFGKGVHNVLEAAWWRVPVIFGPSCKKDPALHDWIDDGITAPINNYAEFKKRIISSSTAVQRGEIEDYFDQYFLKSENVSQHIYSKIREVIS